MCLPLCKSCGQQPRGTQCCKLPRMKLGFGVCRYGLQGEFDVRDVGDAQIPPDITSDAEEDGTAEDED